VAIITPTAVKAEHWRGGAKAAARFSREPLSLLGIASGGPFSVKETPEGFVVTSSDLGTVLTASHSLRADNRAELVRLVAEAAQLESGPTWWTEAWAPWGPGGAAGVSIAKAVAASLGGVAQTAEGV
jgi:hypothetical protein